MAIKTTLAQIEEVQAAITALMTAQSYMMGDIRVTRADLKDLTDRERYLLSKYNRSSRNAGRIRLNLSGGV